MAWRNAEGVGACDDFEEASKIGWQASDDKLVTILYRLIYTTMWRTSRDAGTGATTLKSLGLVEGSVWAECDVSGGHDA